MRRLLSILVLILVASSCSTDNSVIVGNELASGQTSGTIDDGTIDDGTIDGAQEPSSVRSAQAPSTTEPAPEPVYNAPDANPVNVRLTPEDVLLPEDALDAPWEHQHRTLDAITYDAGPQQSDCGDFWRAEQVVSQATANALWWRDGANLVHNVVPFYEFGEAESILAAAGRVADKCPVISWGEGGDYLVSPVSLDIDAIDGVETVSFLVDEGSGQQRWMVFSQRENLVSILSVPTWSTEAPPVTADDVAAAASLAAKRLAAASEERPKPATTPTTAAPAPTPPPETTTPPTSVEPSDFVGDLDPVTDLPQDLIALLLDETDFGPDAGVSPVEIRAHFALPTELPECSGFDALDAELEIDIDLGLIGGLELAQILGRAADSQVAQRHVDNFADSEACFHALFATASDLAAISGEPPSEFSFSIESVEIPGADAAAVWQGSLGGGESTLLFFAVGDIVTGLSGDGSALSPDEKPTLDLIELAETAANKISAAA